MSNIAVIGTGYVGLVSGALLADFGHQVICVDVDTEKIKSLNQGKIPIYEANLEQIVQANQECGRLQFMTDTIQAVQQSDVIFIAVGTPPSSDGSADLSYVLTAAEEIGEGINGYKVIVDKSTVPVGTGRLVNKTISAVLERRGVSYPFDVVSNPEFLREGSAVYDFTHPDRVVIGSESNRARNTMRDVYRVLFLGNTPFLETNLETAEMIKYASNAFLAVKIAYINEIATLCEKVGADASVVARGMGMDGRISAKFLHPGPGYGGSCFPKDTRAIARTGRENSAPMTIVEAAVLANEQQKLHTAKRIQQVIGTINGKTLTVLGLTYKPNTDDMREAPSLVILEELVKYGARLRVCDPQGYKEGSWRIGHLQPSLVFCKDAYEAAVGSDAIILLTEWNCFRSLDFDRIKQQMPGRLFFDFRNVYNPETLSAQGFRYICIGRREVQ